MKDPSRVKVTGPLELYAQSFADDLSEQGYARDSAVAQVQLVAHLSRWMVSEGLSAEGLLPERVEQFARVRRAAGYGRYRSAAALNPLLDYLRARDVVPKLAPRLLATPGDELLARYHRYLVGERSLASYFAHGQIDRPTGRRGCHFGPLTVETGSCVASDVAEMALLSTVWGTCAPFPAIKSRMCEI